MSESSAGGSPDDVRFGIVENDARLAVAIAPDAHRAVLEHVFANRDREVGGVLVGGVEGSRTVVQAALPAPLAREARAELTFTHETWNHVFREVDANYADLTIVGWYHSHPNFGVFLSGHDLFIHRNFFSAEHQVAHVIDPIRCEEGLFGWHDGEVVGLPARACPDPGDRPPAPAPPVKPDTEETPRPSFAERRDAVVDVAQRALAERRRARQESSAARARAAQQESERRAAAEAAAAERARMEREAEEERRRAEAAAAERERTEREAKEESQRAEAAAAERERVEREAEEERRRAEAAAAERDRVEREAAEERRRAEAARTERDRIEREAEEERQRSEAARAERERAEREAEEERRRVEAAAAERERIERETQEARRRAAAAAAERERLERETQEARRRVAAAAAERERIEREAEQDRRRAEAAAAGRERAERHAQEARRRAAAERERVDAETQPQVPPATPAAERARTRAVASSVGPDAAARKRRIITMRVTPRARRDEQDTPELAADPAVAGALERLSAMTFDDLRNEGLSISQAERVLKTRDALGGRFVSRDQFDQARLPRHTAAALLERAARPPA